MPMPSTPGRSRCWTRFAAPLRTPAEPPSCSSTRPRLAAEPDAILLRVVARAIAEVLGPETKPVRLERFEARILGDLRGALGRGAGLRMNLGGALLHLKGRRAPRGAAGAAPSRSEIKHGPRMMPQPRRIHLARAGAVPRLTGIGAFAGPSMPRRASLPQG